MKRYFTIILFLFFFTSCKKDVTDVVSNTLILEPAPTPLGEKTMLDIPYGDHPLQKMDIYLPNGRNIVATPLLIIIHGGEWKGGDKSNMNGYVSLFRDSLKHFAIANINYRLVQNGNFRFPAQENDINNAILFLKKVQDSLNISDKSVLFGESAGAQLALLNAYKLKYPSIRAAIGLGTPPDLMEWYINAPNSGIRLLLEEVTGNTPLQDPVIYFNSSVISHVTISAPPTLLLHGDKDNTIPLPMIKRLQQELIHKGVEVKLIVAENEPHNFSPLGIALVNAELIKFLSSPFLFR